MDKTIAAISTALSHSGIGIIRISGDEAVDIADKIYRSKKNIALSHVESHTINYGFIFDGSRLVDEVLVSVMRAPHTYTGEDTVEINCHGGVLVVREILELVLKSGAKLAEPGEFSKRAFLNGKMDLTKAEAVIGVINAKNDFALKSSVKQLSGKVAEKIKELRDYILDQTAYIEAALDDPEHYDLNGYNSILLSGLLEVGKDLKGLIERGNNGSVLAEGVNTVIAGRPNAGKSSLLNLLSGTQKAIVTDIEGTTRDTIEEQIILGGISIHLMDTAGIRDTDDKVEMIGVERARMALQDADLVLYLIDINKGVSKEDVQILSDCSNKPVIILFNKSDLEVSSESGIPGCSEFENIPQISFSAKTGQGLEQLEAIILSLFHADEIMYNDQVIITNIRHKHLLEEALKSIELAVDSVNNEMPEDFYTIDLMNAYSQLGFILGEEVDEDVVNRIFEKFCMGK